MEERVLRKIEMLRPHAVAGVAHPEGSEVGENLREVVQATHGDANHPHEHQAHGGHLDADEEKLNLGVKREQSPVKIRGKGVGLRSDDLEGGLDEEYGIVFEEAEDFKQAQASAATAKLGLKAPTDFQRRENGCDQIFLREQARAVVLVGSLDTAGGVHRVADYSEVDFVGIPELADEDGAVVEPDAGLE